MDPSSFVIHRFNLASDFSNLAHITFITPTTPLSQHNPLQPQHPTRKTQPLIPALHGRHNPHWLFLTTPYVYSQPEEDTLGLDDSEWEAG
jgi:hypothetical protein